jgi:hypothetical protein
MVGRRVCYFQERAIFLQKNIEPIANLCKMVKIDLIDGEVLLFSFQVGEENVQGITDFNVESETLHLINLHLQGSESGKIGRSTLWEMAKDLGRQFQTKKVVIQGGKRTTGKYKGQVPTPITIIVD